MRLKDKTISANTGLDAIKRAPIVDYDTGLKCIRIQDISQKKHYNDWGFTEVSDNDRKKFLLMEGDLLVARTGATVGVSKYVNSDMNAVHNNGTIRLKLDKTVNSRFVYYVFQTKSFLQYIDNISCVATQPNLRIDGLLRFNLPDYSLDKQNKILSILSTYDNLIENNNKRIKLLEQMAENLYKEWFVRFRFPGYEDVEFVGSSLGKIPSTFNIVKIGTVIEYYIGGGWGEEELSELFPEEAYVVRGTDFPNVKHGILDSCPLRYHKSSNYKQRAFKVNDIAFEVSGGTQKQPVGRSILITERQLDRFNNRLICASFCKLIRCNIKRVSPRYFYHWLQYLYETRIIEQFQSQSTGIINFKFEYFLRKCNLMIPPKDIMDKFTESVKPLYDEIDNLAEQNSKLISQRDLLLPRLMSGKLEV